MTKQEKLITFLRLTGFEFFYTIYSNSILIFIPKNFRIHTSVKNNLDYFFNTNLASINYLLPSSPIRYITKNICYDPSSSIIIIEFSKDNPYIKYKITGRDLDTITPDLSDYIYYILDEDFNNFKDKEAKTLTDKLFKTINERKRNYKKYNLHYFKNKEEAIYRFTQLKNFFLDIMNVDAVFIEENKDEIKCKVLFPNTYGQGTSFFDILKDYLDNKPFDKEKYYHPNYIIDEFDLSIEKIAQPIYSNYIFSYNKDTNELHRNTFPTPSEDGSLAEEYPSDIEDVIFYFLPIDKENVKFGYGKYRPIGLLENKELKPLIDEYINRYERKHYN